MAVVEGSLEGMVGNSLPTVSYYFYKSEIRSRSSFERV